MKVVGIISSPHEQGSTALLVRKVLEGAKAKGAEVEEIFLPNYKIEFCNGCFTCMSKGFCPINDDVKILKEKIYSSDGIVLSSPSYGIDMCARMKNFFVDRIGMFEAYTSSLSGKYFIGISTAGAIGANKVARKLVKFYSSGIFKRAYITGYLGVSVGNKTINDYPKKIKKAYKLGEKLINDIYSKKKYHFQNAFTRILNILLKKVFIQNIKKNKDGFMNAVYLNLKERKLVNF